MTFVITVVIPSYVAAAPMLTPETEAEHVAKCDPLGACSLRLSLSQESSGLKGSNTESGVVIVLVVMRQVQSC